MSKAYWADETFSDKERGKPAVFFRAVQKLDQFQSERQDRPVYREIIHTVIRIPGDSTLVHDQPTTAADKKKYATEWAHWQQTRESRVLGTPIEMWHAISDTMKAEFKALHIQTVEQFANLPDSMGTKIMGFQDLRNKARAFVESGKDAELVAKLKAEAEAETSKLKSELAELRALIEGMAKPAKQQKVTA